MPRARAPASPAARAPRKGRTTPAAPRARRTATTVTEAPTPQAKAAPLVVDTVPALEADHAGPAEVAAAGNDPYPFVKDPWGIKLLILVVVFLPIVALGYAGWRLWGAHFHATEMILFFGLWTFTGLGISVGFHRMLTHRAFAARPVTKFLLLLAGSMSIEGPPAVWAATHLRHHAKADREGDPHSPLDGFWHAHTGWLLRDRTVSEGVAYHHLMEDPMVAFMTRTWKWWAIFSFVLPAAIGLAVHRTWMGALDAFVWGGLLRIFILHHTTWSVNSIGHMFGTRPFKTTDRGANNALVALLGWGEGWHNNHHAFPRSAYIGLRWWQVDPGAWLVVFLKWIGQVDRVWSPTKDMKAERRRV